MNKIVVGAGAVLVALLCLSTWRWSAAIEREGKLSATVAQRDQTIRDQDKDLALARGRATILDQSLTILSNDRQAVRDGLAQIQSLIQDLPRSEGDSDASFQCLDVPLPAAAAGLLRKP